MLVYKVNFPREGKLEGAKFKGDEKLKEELLGRGIIGEAGESIELSEDEAEVERLSKENEELKAEVERLKGFLAASIELPKGKLPEGYEDGKES